MLADDRTLRRKALRTHQSYKVAANTQIHKNAIVAVQGGYLVPAMDAPGHRVVGLADEDVDNRGNAEGALECMVYKGGARIPTTTPNPIEQAHVGQMAYVLDDEFVVTAAGTTASIPAGEVMEVEDGYAWVDIGAWAAAASA